MELLLPCAVPGLLDALAGCMTIIVSLLSNSNGCLLYKIITVQHYSLLEMDKDIEGERI